MVRTFISVDFNDPDIISRIMDIQQEILKSGAKLKLVNPENLHITLEFLGEIAEEQITVIQDILNTINFERIKLSVNRIGVLPNENYIRVVFCEINGDVEGIKRVQREIRENLRKHGFKTDKRAFKPHLTIARVKSPQNRKELMLVIKKFSTINCGVQEITSINLKKSVLKPEGPEYSTLYKVDAEK